MKANTNQRAVELSNLPEHAHDAGAVHQDKTDHITGPEHTRQTKEHSSKNFLGSLAADRFAAKRANEKRAKK